jgi:hypothetical protein
MEIENFVSEQTKKFESQPHLLSFINLLYFQFTKGILCSYDLKKYIDKYAQTPSSIKSKVIHGGKLKVVNAPTLTKVDTLYEKEQLYTASDVYTILDSAKTKMSKIYTRLLNKNDKLHAELIEFVSKYIHISKFDTADKKANFASILKNRIIMNTYTSEKFCIDLLHFDLNTQTFNNDKYKNDKNDQLIQLIDLIDKYQPNLYTYYLNYNNN